jgi:hypothetical protein
VKKGHTDAIKLSQKKYQCYYSSNIDDSVTFHIKITTSDTVKPTATINLIIVRNSERDQICPGFYFILSLPGLKLAGQTPKHMRY